MRLIIPMSLFIYLVVVGTTDEEDDFVEIERIKTLKSSRFLSEYVCF